MVCSLQLKLSGLLRQISERKKLYLLSVVSRITVQRHLFEHEWSGGWTSVVRKIKIVCEAGCRLTERRTTDRCDIAKNCTLGDQWFAVSVHNYIGAEHWRVIVGRQGLGNGMWVMICRRWGSAGPITGPQSYLGCPIRASFLLTRHFYVAAEGFDKLKTPGRFGIDLSQIQ